MCFGVPFWFVAYRRFAFVFAGLVLLRFGLRCVVVALWISVDILFGCFMVVGGHQMPESLWSD